MKYVFSNRGSIKVFHSGYYVLDTPSMSPKRISSNIGPILQRCKNFEKQIGNVFDMKLIQNSEIRVFKSAIPVPPRESVAV